MLVLMMASLAYVAEATIGLTIGALTLTAAQVTALAGFGLLAGAKGLLLGSLLGRGARNSRRSRHRGRRQAVGEEDFDAVEEVEEKVMNIEMLAALEPENCFKRLFCSAATGQLGNKGLEQSLNIVQEAMVLEPRSPYTQKYRQAAYFGASRQDIAKCEHHYQCSISMDLLKQIFA